MFSVLPCPPSLVPIGNQSPISVHWLEQSRDYSTTESPKCSTNDQQPKDIFLTTVTDAPLLDENSCKVLQTRVAAKKFLPTVLKLLESLGVGKLTGVFEGMLSLDPFVV